MTAHGDATGKASRKRFRGKEMSTLPLPGHMEKKTQGDLTGLSPHCPSVPWILFVRNESCFVVGEDGVL